MQDVYEFMRATIVKQEDHQTTWRLITAEGEKIMEVPEETDSNTVDLLNILGKEGWHFGTRSEHIDFLQRKVRQKNDC